MSLGVTISRSLCDEQLITRNAGFYRCRTFCRLADTENRQSFIRAFFSFSLLQKDGREESLAEVWQQRRHINPEFGSDQV